MPHLNSSKIVQRLDILWWFVDHLNSYIQLKGISSEKKMSRDFYQEKPLLLANLFLMSVKTPMWCKCQLAQFCPQAGGWCHSYLIIAQSHIVLSVESRNRNLHPICLSCDQRKWHTQLSINKAREKNVNSPP